jgi:nucleoid-associated protein YgaU
MTSDAKIGLLLGLVFIFVIAFIINGLPNFGNRSQAEAAPMTNFVDENLGVAAGAQNAQEQLDWETLLAQGSDDSADSESVAAEHDADVLTPETAMALNTEGETVRSVRSFDSLMGGVSRTIEDVIRGIGEASQSVTLQAETSEPAPVFQAPGPRVAPAPVETARSHPSVPTESAGKTPASEVYVVQEGDVLATVAKKAYGPEEGNRLINVQRIFEANRMILKSPDEIVVGQKLVIPPLPKGEVDKTDPVAVLDATNFEKVESVSKKVLADMKQDKPKGRYYVVQEGDSLWKIAETQLNSGASSEEIAKLNSDILESKDTLSIGMRLRLPAK